MEHTASQCYLVVQPLSCRASAYVLSSQLLNEIMPMIYKRFTDKAAEEWRQIYKVGRIATLSAIQQPYLPRPFVLYRVSSFLNSW